MTDTQTKQDTHKILLTRCEIAVYITQEMRDDDPEQTQSLFDAVEKMLADCKTVAAAIDFEYPLLLRVEVNE